MVKKLSENTSGTLGLFFRAVRGQTCKTSIAVALLPCLAACNLARDFQRPEPLLPKQWRNAATAADSTVDPYWWRTFGSAELDRLISDALAHNTDLNAGKQRIAQARAQATIAGAPLWPSLATTGSMIDNRYGNGDSQQQTGRIEMAYEIDLWGANRARRDAGAARLSSLRFAFDALRLVVMAEVAQNYFSLLALAERRRIAEDFLRNAEAIRAIVSARLTAGAASAVELAEQQAELATAKANVALLIQQAIVAENALAVLLGKPPRAPVSVINPGFAELKTPVLAAQQPSELLLRRPDIRQIEMELRAAHADITVARAAFYPSVQINLEPLVASAQPVGTALSLAAALSQPIFQGGRLEGELERTQARQRELLAIYRQTVLTALQEVEDAAATRRLSGRRYQALTDAVEEARKAYRLSSDRYRVGLIDYQTVLTTQRSLLNAEISQVQARLDVLTALARLYKALGGGWRETMSEAGDH